MTASSGSHPASAASRVAACIAVVMWCHAGFRASAADGFRDWSDVQLAWRGDPRPAADLPTTGTVPSPPEPRPSRRAMRRAARRGIPQETSRTPPRAVGAPPAGDQLEPPRAIVIEPAATGKPLESIAHRDRVYGSGGHRRQRFDLHIPAGCSGGGLPLVVWIEGDDWQSGAKAECPLTWLVARGYAVASIGYRPSDEAVFPAQLDDCREAVATILAEAETWGIDRDRVCVVGSGAGGHLAALVGFSSAPSAPAPAATDPPAVAAGPAAQTAADVTAVCTIAAPVHLTTLGAAHDRSTSAASRLVGGPLPEIREAALAASPLVHVSADDPPTLVLHGRHDATIPVDQAARLHRSLEAAGVDSRLVILDAGHPVPLDETAPAGRELVHFLDRVLGPGQHTLPAAVEPRGSDEAEVSSAPAR